jgi:alkanesulfonate monooxygenase SsuD/methylene tetrahydromethanopterin reductase-like flavin-dependent oxidoreductase (luciferase family)
MKFAINVPNFGEYGDPCLLVALARDAEDAGWDGFFIWDHIQGFVPDERVPMADPWVALAAIAVATTRIRMGTFRGPLGSTRARIRQGPPRTA